MSFREGREKRDHRSSYIGIRNGFGKGAEAKFENIIVGRRHVLSRHKGAKVAGGGEGEVSAFYRAIFSRSGNTSSQPTA